MKYLIIMFLIIFLQSAIAETNHHSHDHHGNNDVKLSLNKGNKWPTDKALRENMSAIHDQIKTNLVKIHSNKMKTSDYEALGKNIEKNVHAIFSNCKLPPKADAQLHIVLSEIVLSIQKISGKSSLEVNRKAVENILASYKAYLNHFDHSSQESHRK